MSTFFKPFSTKLHATPLIIYPMKGVETKHSRTQPRSIENYLEKLYQKYQLLQNGMYHVVLLWKDGKDLMTDVWIFSSLESEETGYSVDCKTFRNQTLITDNGISASDGLIMLGRECELEEGLRKSGKDLDQYIFGKRPSLPDDLQPIKEFYL